MPSSSSQFDATEMPEISSSSALSEAEAEAEAGPGPFPAPRPERGRLWKMLVASLAFHALLSPFPALLSLLELLSPPAPELPPEDALTGIPVDLVADEPETPAPAEPAPPTEQPTSSAPPEPMTAPEAPAPAPPASPPAPAEKPETPAAPDPAQPANPVALAGQAGQLADSNADVRILLYTDVVRAHPLGLRIGGLLRRSPQWSDFFGPTDVDPIRDVDRVLIAGPELRSTDNVVAVLGHHLPEARIDEALERLVSRSGTWLDREHRLARAKADRAERLFSAPKAGIVAVAPLSVEKSLRRLGKRLSFPRSSPDVALHAFLAHPQKPLRALGLRLPESLAWLEITAVPEADGGVKLLLRAEDESPELAQKNAQKLEAALRQASEIDFSRMGTLGALAAFALGTSKQKVVESIDLTARENRIEGVVIVTAKQLRNLLDLLDAVLPPPAPAPAPPSGAGSESEKGMPSGDTPPPADTPAADTPVGDTGPASPPPAPTDEPPAAAPSGDP